MSSPNPSVQLKQHEPIGVYIIEEYPKFKYTFRVIGWLEFWKRLQGYHDVVVKSFATSFDGQISTIGDMNFSMTEARIAAIGRSPIVGGIWFKFQNFLVSSCNQF